MSKRLVCRAILVSAVLSALLVPGCTTKEECAKAVDGGAGVDQQRDQQQNVSPQCLTAYKKLKACVDAWDCQALTDAAAKAACLMRQQLLKSDTLPATLKTDSVNCEASATCPRDPKTCACTTQVPPSTTNSCHFVFDWFSSHCSDGCCLSGTSCEPCTKCRYLYDKGRCNDGCCFKGDLSKLDFSCEECAGCYYQWTSLSCSSGCCYWFDSECYNCGDKLETVTAPKDDRSDWMKAVADRPLNMVLLPGTHHTGVCQQCSPIGTLNPWTVCQAMSLGNQLKAGVRWIDFRVNAQGTHVSHGQYSYIETLGLPVPQFLADLRAFLEGHPSEVIILLPRESNDPTDWKKVTSAIDAISDRVYTGSDPLTKNISELAGKIIICRNGNTIDDKYRTLSCDGSYGETQTNNPYKLIPDRLNTWLKMRKVGDETSARYLESMITADYTSYGTSAFGDISSLEDAAKVSNYLIFEWLKNMKDDEKRRFVLYTRSMWTDFANPRVLDQLIDANQILPKNAGELAKGKTATQSCEYKDSYPASKGVDGDITDQNFTHTCDDKKTGKWWQVDLGAAKTIVAVRIWSRMFYANLLKNFDVMISADGSTWTKFASYNSAGINEHEFLGKMTGRYVRIVNNDDGVMSVREVKVFGGDP